MCACLILKENWYTCKCICTCINMRVAKVYEFVTFK